MKFSDGLFLETCRGVAAEHPGVAFEERIIDALVMRLVQRPQDFDVLVLPNLYGDLVSELCAGLVGGPGVVPAADLGDGVAVFGSLHGSASPHAGAGGADPTAMLLAGAMLLRHLGETDAADRLERAVAEVISEGRSVTVDLRADAAPAVTTDAMTDAIVARLEA
jgi:isocitrate dehydrogenase (NAD+)